MQVVLEEAHESYAGDIVIVRLAKFSQQLLMCLQELPSSTSDDMESNVQHILAWIEEYRAAHGLH